MRLWAKTSVADTDWTAKLLDVDKNGKSTNVCDGVLRARFNKSLETECFVNNNQKIFEFLFSSFGSKDYPNFALRRP